jgi:hypothetical protein
MVRAAPADAELHAAVVVAASSAATAGRKVAAVRFEAELDRWVDRFGAGEVLADDLLLKLAPRHRGRLDAYWLAGAHLASAGAAVPKFWRSPVSGEPINNANPHPTDES